jgi:chloramphenicol-sensitive protein RarD
MRNNEAEFGQDFRFSLALATSGIATVIPLLLFNAATTRLPLTISGLLQYVTPSIMFLMGIVIFHEPMRLTKLIGIVFIWVALLILGKNLRKSDETIN